MYSLVISENINGWVRLGGVQNVGNNYTLVSYQFELSETWLHVAKY